MSRLVMALSLFILVSRGTIAPNGIGSTMDPDGGNPRPAITRATSPCVDPYGRGLGIDPIGC